ncbi:MAG: 50S ribosomal protein L9 [Verrucomicrobia bacterium]|nr:50S ribosomal protein L9 [Verrucomicrobiota bacterium]MDE3047781.1 50S ribosomal protein L9 [Verrucomicrobiota bacterium]
MKQHLLLLQDVEALGKKGEIVTAKPGYVRNYLLPRGLAIIASPNTLRKQESLRAERAKQAVIDRKESEELAIQIEGISLETRVKVDPEGHMYGSVSAGDIAQLFQEKGLPVEKKSVLVNKPIKETGTHKISLKLKEGVSATCQLMIIPEGVAHVGIEAVTAPLPVEEKKEEEQPE